MQKRIGLFINGYDSEGKLKAGSNDVLRIFNILTDEKFGQCDKKLSKKEINIRSKDDFQKILNTFISNFSGGDQLLLYFSGHGDYKGSNYHLKFGDDLYSFKTLLSEIESALIVKSIIILDACFSGAATQGRKSNNTIYLPELPLGSAILTSSSEGEFSYEKDDKTYSVFTDLLCECIETGNNNNPTSNNLITLTDVINYIDSNNSYEKQQKAKYAIENAENSIWLAKNISIKETEQIEKNYITAEDKFYAFYNNIFISVYADMIAILADKPSQVIIEQEYALAHLAWARRDNDSEHFKKALDHIRRAALDCYKISYVELKDKLSTYMKNKDIADIFNLDENIVISKLQSLDTLISDARKLEKTIGTTHDNEYIVVLEKYGKAVGIGYELLNALDVSKNKYHKKRKSLMKIFLSWFNKS